METLPVAFLTNIWQIQSDTETARNFATELLRLHPIVGQMLDKEMLEKLGMRRGVEAATRPDAEFN